MTGAGDNSPVGKYRALASSLAETADATVRFLKKELGIANFRIEEPIHEEVGGRPTLSAAMREADIIAVEVSDTAYPHSLDQLVLDCKSLGLPVKVYVAMPRAAEDPSYKENTTRARKLGVGLLEVDEKSGVFIYEALSLSLTGVRPIDKKQFPARYRPRLVTAEGTFRAGSADKACAILYDEIESITRGAGRKALQRGAWTKAKPAGHKPGIDLEKGEWRSVVATITKHCDFKKCGCPGLTEDLLTRVSGVVGYRNQVGHKPRKLAERVKRDTQLRTRFESAADVLQDLLAATRTLRL